MAFTLNRRLAQLIDSSGQLNTGKIPNDYITSDHVADNSITTAMLHTGFTLPTSSLTSIDTDNVTEGSSNLYYTNARADARIAAADTDDLSEGSTNLYYTDARVATYISGNRDYGNITTTGYIAGPATFTIDPAAVGDNTGTVVIAGNLQVDGTTTTINSTTLTVDDKLVTLASGSANAGAANGAGIEVDISGATNTSLTYDGTNDEWDFNQNINVTGTVTSSSSVISPTLASPDGTGVIGLSNTGEATFYRGAVFNENSNDSDFRVESNNNTHMLFVDAGNDRVGISTTSPDFTLDVEADKDTWISRIYNTGSDANAQALLVRSDATAAHDTTVMGVYADGGYKMVVRSTGKVGIGETNPTNAKLEIVQAGDHDAHSTHGIAIHSTGNTNFTSMYMGCEDAIDSAYIQSVALDGSFTSKSLLLNANGGNVGIGTTSP